MPTDRKFCRFAPTDRPLQTQEIPEGGICLSAFVVLSESGHRDRVLMGHLDPSAGRDHIGALDPERAALNSKSRMLPSSHLLLGESPQAAPDPILQKQLRLARPPLNRPHVRP